MPQDEGLLHFGNVSFPSVQFLLTDISQNNNTPTHTVIYLKHVSIKTLRSTHEEENYGTICVMELYPEIIAIQSFQQEKWPRVIPMQYREYSSVLVYYELTRQASHTGILQSMRLTVRKQ